MPKRVKKQAAPAEKPKLRPGPKTRYPGKVHLPFPLQLTPQLHETLLRESQRLKVRRGDLICRLIELHAERLQAW